MADKRYKKVCLRMTEEMINDLKTEARDQGIGYNELVRQVMDRYIHRDRSTDRQESGK